MNRIRGKRIKLPVLSELREQRLRLHEQIRENRRARHRAFRDRIKRMLQKGGNASGSAPGQKNDKEENDHETK